MDKRIVITGASGHIGYHIAAQLLLSGYKPTLLIRTENRNIADLKNCGADVRVVDFSNAGSYNRLLENADILFHAASENTTAAKNKESIIANTYGLTKGVIDAAITNKVKTIVYTSSVVVLGRSVDPLTIRDENDKATHYESPYVEGKILAEEYCESLVNQNKADIRRIYPSWVIGSNNAKDTPPQKVIRNYLKWGQWFYFKGGISVASVQEVAGAHINAWLKGKKNGRYVTAGHNVTFKEFFTALAEYTGYTTPFIYIPTWIIYAASVVIRVINPNAALNPRYVQAVVGAYSWYSSEKAIKELDYTISPISLMISKAARNL